MKTLSPIHLSWRMFVLMVLLLIVAFLAGVSYANRVQAQAHTTDAPSVQVQDKPISAEPIAILVAKKESSGFPTILNRKNRASIAPSEPETAGHWSRYGLQNQPREHDWEHNIPGQTP